MIPYVVLLTAVGGLGFALCEYKPSRKKELIFAAVAAAMMFAMIICRGERVGIDYHHMYRPYFLQTLNNGGLAYMFAPANPLTEEFLFTLINAIACFFTDDPMVFYAFIGLLIVGLRMLFIVKYSPKVWISIFMYIALGFFSYSMCTLRQELAISIAMFALPHLLNRKPIPFFLIMIPAGFIHNSIFILIPFYFLALLPSAKKWVMALYAAGLTVVIMFSETLLKLFTDIFPRFGLYSDGSYYLRGRDVNTVFIWAVLLILCSFYYKRIVERDPKNHMLFNLYLFGSLIMLLTVKTFIFQRVALLLLPFSVMLIAEVFAAIDFRESEFIANDKSIPANKRTAARKLADEQKRMYYSMMALFFFVAVLEFFFLLNMNRLGLVPYIPFWM